MLKIQENLLDVDEKVWRRVWTLKTKSIKISADVKDLKLKIWTSDSKDVKVEALD